MAGAKTKTVRWNSAAHLKSDEDIAHYLEAVSEDGDPELIAHAMRVVARARGTERWGNGGNANS